MSRSDDPRLTAFALGLSEDELDAGDRAADSIEQRVAESETMRREVAEIRATARLLSAALAAEPAPSLTPEHRRAVADAARSAARQARRPIWAFPAVAGLAAAALLLGVALVGNHRSAQREDERRSADAPLVHPTAPAAPTAPVAEATPDDTPMPSGKPRGGPRRARPRAAAPVTVEGVVQDEAGAPIPGATVVVRSAAEGIERSAVSNERGQFRVAAAPAGDLDLRVELDGFVTAHARAAPPPGSSVRWNPALRTGMLTEQITVAQDLSALALADERRRVEGESSAAVLAGAMSKTVARRHDDAFLDATTHPLVTVGRDAGSTSYDDVRRSLDGGELPPQAAVRIDEMINAFAFASPLPEGRQPVAAELELGPAPWEGAHRLLRIAVGGPHVEIQVRFNPLLVRSYRPIGHSSRPIRPAALTPTVALDGGQSLTAFFEIVPADEWSLARGPKVEVFRYQKPAQLGSPARSGELVRLTIRYREASGRASLKEWTLRDHPTRHEPSADFQFAASVAAFGRWLGGSPPTGGADADRVLRLAEEGRGPDPAGDRAEFIELVKKARELWRQAAEPPPH